MGARGYRTKQGRSRKEAGDKTAPLRSRRCLVLIFLQVRNRQFGETLGDTTRDSGA